MATDPIQAPREAVYGAGLVRLAELGRALLTRWDAFLTAEDYVRALIDLRTGLEHTARSADPVERAVLGGYLIETYGLRGIYTDPLLRPLLPPVPLIGAAIHRRVRAANGRAVGGNGRFIASGTVLVPAPTL